MMWTWLAVMFVTNVFGHNRKHDCIHDEIPHQISQQFVKYQNPSKSKNDIGRNLLESISYQPIRIRPYYDDITINSVGDDKIEYIKALVSSSIHYLEQFVSVIPIQGPLFINRCQRVWNYNQFIFNTCPISDYAKPLQCQYAIIPEEHIAESWFYDPITLKSYLYKKAGKGIDDADLVIYVTYSSAQCSDDGSTLAWASICNLDQFGRPISGTINFCPGALETNYWKFDIGVTLHEIMHILAMSNSLFPYFYNWSTGTFFNQETVVIDMSVTGLDNTYIITDKVQQVSRSHFGCNSLIGAPLENSGADGTIGSHWESKYLQSELMCGMMYSAVLYLSDFTLALMEDSGWYSIDYEYSDPFTWGYNEGCAFLNADCISKLTGSSNFEQYWCTSTTDDGCSYDYSTVSHCVNEQSGTVPSAFRYYSDLSFSGLQSHDYCAFRTPDTDLTYTDYEQTCWDLRGNAYSLSLEYPYAQFGVDSRCVELSDGDGKSGYCFRHTCTGWDNINQRYNAVEIIIEDGFVNDAEIVICSQSDKSQWKQLQSYSANIKCPNVDTVCGTTHKPFECYWGHYSDTLAKCICSVGYTSGDCSDHDMDRSAEEASTAEFVSLSIASVQFGTGICISSSSSSFVNGYYQFNGEYEGLPAYIYDDNEGYRYLYYLRYYSQWNIGVANGDLSIYAYCVQSLSFTQVIDIADCELWAVWDDITGWIYDFGVQVFHCTPTYVPSIDPTVVPSIQLAHDPTTNPTVDPTYNPTMDTSFPSKNPTVQPSIASTAPPTLPTYGPTKTPTGNPTEVPTIEPAYDPTVKPTIDPSFPSKNPTVQPSIDSTTPPSLPTYGPTNPTGNPTSTEVSTIEPAYDPTVKPTINPSKNQTVQPGIDSTAPPTLPTYGHTKNPTGNPTEVPTIEPVYDPTVKPTINPSFPSKNPTVQPTIDSTTPHTLPTYGPTKDPTGNPTEVPTIEPVYYPTTNPIVISTEHPTSNPTLQPIHITSSDRTIEPSASKKPVWDPSIEPSWYPNNMVTDEPSLEPTNNPTNVPTLEPILDDSTEIRRPPPLMVTIDSAEAHIEHVLIVENSTGSELMVAVTTFIVACSFIFIGLLLLWMYCIKPRFIEKRRRRRSSTRMSSCSEISQKVMNDSDENEAEDDINEYVVTQLYAIIETAFVPSREIVNLTVIDNTVVTSNGESHINIEGMEKIPPSPTDIL